MDSVENFLRDFFKEALFINMPTHDVISKQSYYFIRESDFTFVGGTNLLSSNMNHYNQWKVSLWDSLFIKNIILMGVGWWQYQNKPNFYTSMLYKRLLSREYLHSVRDSYTEQHLKSIGISNVINTSCPTMWRLTEEHCARIPKEKSEFVVVTFTEYNQDQHWDSKLIGLLNRHYKQIYFWTQQPDDWRYMQNICGHQVVYLQPSLKALDEILGKPNFDYVGTRLHAGVRALQHRKRTLILSVDNRATEIAKDTNLPVVRRDDLEAIENWIQSSYETKVKIPQDRIELWRSQFLA